MAGDPGVAFTAARAELTARLGPGTLARLSAEAARLGAAGVIARAQHELDRLRGAATTGAGAER